MRPMGRAGDLQCRSAAVACIQNILGLFKPMQSPSVNQKPFLPLFFNQNAHPAEAVDGRKAVSARKEAFDFRKPFSQGAEHDGPVGDRFVAGDGEFTF